ncbi:MAG: hypothetical protein ABIJ45_13255 [Candidatus Zixiibacteriota bacterium]
MSEEKDKEQLSLELGKPSISNENTEEESGEALEWVCHPAKRRMKVTVLVTLFLIILVVVVWFVTYSKLLTVLSGLFLYGSMSSYYFPTKYKLTGKKIIVKTTMQTLTKEWPQYRTYYPDKNGVLLSPFARRTRMENFRGLYVKYEGNKHEVDAMVKRIMEAQKTLTDEGAS